LVPGMLSDFSVAIIDATPVASNQLIMFRSRMLDVAKRFGLLRGADHIPGYSAVLCNKANDVSEHLMKSKSSIEFASAKPLLGVVPFDFQVLFSADKFNIPDVTGDSEFAFYTAQCFAEMLGRPGLEDDTPLDGLYGRLFRSRRRRKLALGTLRAIVLVIFLVSLVLALWSVIAEVAVLEVIRNFQIYFFGFGVAAAVVTLGLSVYRWSLFSLVIQPPFQRVVRVIAAVLGMLAMARIGVEFYSALDVLGLQTQNVQLQSRLNGMESAQRSFQIIPLSGEGRVLRLEMLAEGCTVRDLSLSIPSGELASSGISRKFNLNVIGDSGGASASIVEQREDESGLRFIRIRISGSGDRGGGGKCRGAAKVLVADLRLAKVP
jgi:hypothetical protein